MDALQQLTPGFAIGQIIQLATAPVFLVAAIAGLLAMLSIRLGRVIDRARVIELRLPQVREQERRNLLSTEIGTQWERIRLINWSIRLCVGGALMICLVVVTLFIGQLTASNLSTVIAVLFVLAMLSVIAGLVCLLIEIGIATKRSQEGMEAILQGIETQTPQE